MGVAVGEDVDRSAAPVGSPLSTKPTRGSKRFCRAVIASAGRAGSMKTRGGGGVGEGGMGVGGSGVEVGVGAGVDCGK